MNYSRIAGWLLMGLVLLAVAWLSPLETGAQEANRVGLVVQMGDGDGARVEMRCIEFQEAQISGYDVLLRSGLALEVSVDAGSGAFVCGIGGAGCPATDCRCQFPPNYWSYWHLSGAWVYSQAGVGDYEVNPGDVEGWSWGAGTPPTVIPFDQICAPPTTDTPTATATWTLSPTAKPTDTLPPTDTPRPTASDTPLPPETNTATLPPATLAAAAAGTAMTPRPTPMKATTGTAAPAPAKAPTATLAADIVVPSATAAPTGLVTLQPPSVTAIPATLLPDTALPAQSAQPSVTPLPVPTESKAAVAAVGSAAGDKESGNNPAAVAATPTRGRPSPLLTLVSIGAGLAYLLFGLFIVILAALFMVARARQR